jgi:hypothetical protein
MTVTDVIAQMHKELAEISLLDKDTQDATYHGAKAICTGLAGILGELERIRELLEAGNAPRP